MYPGNAFRCTIPHSAGEVSVYFERCSLWLSVVLKNKLFVKGLNL